MKTPCQCPACQILALLALTLVSEGLIADAETVASKVGWVDDADSSEGYTNTWTRPTNPDSVASTDTKIRPDSLDLN